MKRIVSLAVLLLLWAVTMDWTMWSLERAAAQTAPVHDSSRWHPPGFGHEHGDPPPDWLVQADQDPTFHHYFGSWLLYEGAFSTSSAENTAKHAGMKGFRLAYNPDPALGFSGVDGSWLDGYVIVHGFSNPMDRGSQSHSGRVAILDQGMGATMRQGWINVGDPATARVPARCGAPAPMSSGADCSQYNAAQRPVILFVDQESWDFGLRQEQWYPFGIGFAWGISYNATTIRTPGETKDDTDPAHWTHTGADGTLRSIDLNTCIPGSSGCGLPASVLGQGFLTDQKGVGVTNPAVCESEIVCLVQYYSPTFKGMKGRDLDTDFPNPPGGVVLPN